MICVIALLNSATGEENSAAAGMRGIATENFLDQSVVQIFTESRTIDHVLEHCGTNWKKKRRLTEEEKKFVLPRSSLNTTHDDGQYHASYETK